MKNKKNNNTYRQITYISHTGNKISDHTPASLTNIDVNKNQLQR